MNELVATTYNQHSPMDHIESYLIHEVVFHQTEQHQVLGLILNESVSTIEQMFIVEHEYLLNETSWYDNQAQKITSTYMLHEIITAQVNVSKCSETKSLQSEPKVVPISILHKKAELYDIDLE